jgi:hypothetical protein
VLTATERMGGVELADVVHPSPAEVSRLEEIGWSASTADSRASHASRSPAIPIMKKLDTLVETQDSHQRRPTHTALTLHASDIASRDAGTTSNQAGQNTNSPVGAWDVVRDKDNSVVTGPIPGSVSSCPTVATLSAAPAPPARARPCPIRAPNARTGPHAAMRRDPCQTA